MSTNKRQPRTSTGLQRKWPFKDLWEEGDFFIYECVPGEDIAKIRTNLSVLCNHHNRSRIDSSEKNLEEPYPLRWVLRSHNKRNRANKKIFQFYITLTKPENVQQISNETES